MNKPCSLDDCYLSFFLFLLYKKVKLFQLRSSFLSNNNNNNGSEKEGKRPEEKSWEFTIGCESSDRKP